MAVPFDVAALAVTGGPVPLVEDVALISRWGHGLLRGVE